MSGKESNLSRDEIVSAFQRISDELGKRDVKGELCLFGGSVIIFLIRHLKLKSAAEVMDLVASYYPSGRIPVKSQYLVEGLFAEGKI